jgi:hypothetical protein
MLILIIRGIEFSLGVAMSTSRGKLKARMLALAASIAVSIGVWIGVAKPPQATAVSTTAETVPVADPGFSSNDSFLQGNGVPAAQPAPAVQSSPAPAYQPPTYQVQTARTSRFRTRAS